jgi:asparagine synthase (glutamine-hydrolysing)
MCGICGIAAIGATGPPPDRSVLERMSATLRHRGPDSDGIVMDDRVGLAARRLSIIDLEHGDQPIANEDSTAWVIQNGEIYNYRELRTGLERSGHRFRTAADTEVLVHLYEEHGPEFVTLLRGMFAIAVWDARRGRLVLARDAFGIKPLYYRLRDGTLSFASELKALARQPGFSREVDLTALDAYLALNFVPAPRSIFSEARKLAPGHLLVWDGGEPSVNRYERVGPAPRGSLLEGGADELAEELRARLRDSVRAHLVADVPVGVLLSGGVDSSTLAALAAGETDRPLNTFSIGFEEPSFDELALARLVARRYGTDHHELVVRPDAVELLPQIVEAFDEPFADSSAVPTYLVSQLAAGSVKVALSGEGGDELFGGYYTYSADLLAPLLRWPAAIARPIVERLPSSDAKASFDYKAKRFVRAAHLSPMERHYGWKEIFSAPARAELLGDRPRAPGPLELYRERFAESEGAEQLTRLQDLDFAINLVDDLLVKADRASMAHSLEVRVPFCDRVVAEFAFSLPAHAKVRWLAKKRLLRKAVAPLVPAEILRARKRGFSAPIAAWLRGPVQGFAREALSEDALARDGYLDPTAVRRLLDDHASGREDLSRQLWGLLCFTVWLDRQRAPTPA